MNINTDDTVGDYKIKLYNKTTVYIRHTCCKASMTVMSHDPPSGLGVITLATAVVLGLIFCCTMQCQAYGSKHHAVASTMQ